MATPTLTRNAFAPATGSNQLGTLVVTATWTTYAQSGADKLNLSSIVAPGLQPLNIVSVNGVTAAGHNVVWTPNASATESDAGGLSLYNGTTQASAGALATTARLTIRFANGPSIF